MFYYDHKTHQSWSDQWVSFRVLQITDSETDQFGDNQKMKYAVMVTSMKNVFPSTQGLSAYKLIDNDNLSADWKLTSLRPP